MATGSGIPQSQAIVTSDITPTYSIPHDNAIAEALGHLGDFAQGVVNNQIEKHYEKVGTQEGADVASGKTPYHDVPVITDVGRARQAAFQSSYLAGIKTDIDSHLEQTKRDNALNPAGYQEAARAVVSGYTQKAPGPFAVQVQQYAKAKADSGFQALSDEKLHRDDVTAVNGVNARSKTLGDSLVSMASQGQDGTPEFAAAMTEWRQLNASKTANPLFEYAPEQAAAAEDALIEGVQGAVMTHHVLATYHESGPDAALKELSAIPHDERLGHHTRETAFNRARAGLSDAMNIDQERANLVRTNLAQSEQDVRRAIADDTAAVELTGKGTGLTEERVSALGGPSAVLDWYKKKAEALTNFGLYGNLAAMSPDQAAARMAQVNALKTEHLPSEVKNEAGFSALSDAVAIVETNGHSAQTSIKGALGKYQITPDAAATVLGHQPSADEKNRLLHDDDFNKQVHEQILRKNLSDNHGDAFKAVLAYHSGQGNVDKWVKEFGDPSVIGRDPFLQQVRAAGNPESADYPGKIAMASDGGKAWQAWDAAQKKRQTDPAAAVGQSDPMIQAAVTKWQSDVHAGKINNGSGFIAVQAYYDAQDRAGIKKVNQQPLPNASLDGMADIYLGVVQTGDAHAILAWRNATIHMFDQPGTPKTHGHQVMQAILARAGASAAQAATVAGVGIRNPSAGRVEALNRAATATQPGAVIPQKHLDLLKSDPSPQARREFDTVYGVGASDRALKGG